MVGKPEAMARAGFLEFLLHCSQYDRDRQPGPPAGSTVRDKTFV
jgi:hypothetical protein